MSRTAKNRGISIEYENFRYIRNFTKCSFVTIPCLGGPEEDAADNDSAGNGLFEREADRLAEHLRLVVVAGTVVGALLQGRHETLRVIRARIFKLLRSPVLEFLKSLWGSGTEEEWGYCTGPPGYIGWRNSFLGIDSWAPYTYKNTGSGIYSKARL